MASAFSFACCGVALACNTWSMSLAVGRVQAAGPDRPLWLAAAAVNLCMYALIITIMVRG